MEKPAENKHPIATLLKHRWSPRAINASKLIEREKVLSLLEAARWAPSAFNEQPWRYLVCDSSDKKAHEKAETCLVEGNAWAKAAPLLLIACARETFTHNGSPNGWSRHDLGLANENLVLQAVESGLVAHQMAGFDPQKARELFGIPEGFTAVTMIALGYAGDLTTLNPKQQEMEKAPRSRREMEEIAFKGEWGRSI